MELLDKLSGAEQDNFALLSCFNRITSGVSRRSMTVAVVRHFVFTHNSRKGNVCNGGSLFAFTLHINPDG